MRRHTFTFWLVLAGLISTPFISPYSSAETLFQGHSQAYQPALTRFPPPDINFLDAQNQAHTLADYPGQVLVINFWASWCPSCLHEMASLQRLQDVAGARVKVITLNQDLTDSTQIQQLLHRVQAGQLPSLRDPDGRLGYALGQTLLPTTFFIDSNGQVAGQLIGAAEWDSSEALALIQSLHL
ncbi:MAG: TlpA disulfide reductase family protein [Motiliproteus sp.]